MKNRLIKVIFVLIITIIIVCFFCLFKFGKNTLDPNLLNKKWYHYDNSTGFYDTFFMDGVNLSYSISDKKNEYSTCKRYTFNKGKNELVLDCGKKIQVIEVTNEYIVLSIDLKKVKFFSNIDSTLNYEFEAFYNQSISEYKNEMIRVFDLIKISPSRFFEIIGSEDKSKVVFYGDACTSVDCVLSLDIIEKWISLSENIHYVNISEFSDDDMIKLSNINEELLNDKNYYNGIYPRVIVFENNQVLDNFEIKCKGFNCNSIAKIN